MSTKQKHFPAKSKPKSPAKPASQQPANTGTQSNSIEVRETFSGPIPHPTILEEYEKIVPGAAERIIAMAESDMKHQQEMDREELRIAESQVKRGQISAFWLTIIALAVCIFALLMGSEMAASVIAGTTIVALVTAFVIGRKDND
jgi:uncharacterized membrane protein